jgi:Zn-finger nucleic acid-binding protein
VADGYVGCIRGYGRQPPHGHPGKEQYHGSYEHKKHRKKSFFAELFD